MATKAVPNADLFAPAQPAHYGGNRVPAAYLSRFTGPPADDTDEPGGYDQMPPHMQWFVRSICDMRSPWMIQYDNDAAARAAAKRSDDDDTE